MQVKYTILYLLFRDLFYKKLIKETINKIKLLFELYQKEYGNKDSKIKEESMPERNTNLEMKIILKHDQPIAYRARSISYDNKEKLRNILDDLLWEGIIKESRSPYSSPIVLIKKRKLETPGQVQIIMNQIK